MLLAAGAGMSKSAAVAFQDLTPFLALILSPSVRSLYTGLASATNYCYNTASKQFVAQFCLKTILIHSGIQTHEHRLLHQLYHENINAKESGSAA